MAEICRLLEEGRFPEASTLLNDPKVPCTTKNDALSLIPAACLGLNLATEDSDFAACEEVLLAICRAGNPKEALLALLDGAERFGEDEDRFCLLLGPIREVLHQVPGKRGKTLQWVLSALHTHVSTLPTPRDHDFEGQELVLLDLDPDVRKVARTLRCYLDFLEPLVREVDAHRQAVAYSDRIVHQREILQRFLLKLLDRPLLFHDLHVRHGKAKSSIQVCCQLLVDYITSTTRNIFALYQFEAPLCPEDPESDAVPTLALAVLAYLTFVENLVVDCHPYVYSHIYLFRRHTRFIESLLEKKDNVVVFKGLRLCQALLENVGDFELASGNLDAKLSDMLLDVAIYCRVRKHRALAVKLFSEHVRKLERKGRYARLMTVISVATHSGVRGLVIDTYRDFLHHSLQSKADQNFFIGKKLQTFLGHALSLQEGAETDILENCDQLVSGLNFVRYVILRDPREENVTGIWHWIGLITNDYLLPLQRGIELSRAHYELEARLVKEGKQCKDMNVLNDTVTVNDEVLPNLPPNYKADALKKALLSLDMIESILFRLKEILGD